MRVLLVSPIDPRTRGSGLALRAEMWRRGLSRVADVEVAVLPLAGGLRGAGYVMLPDDVLGAMRSTLARPAWREFLAAADPLPRAVRGALPSAGAGWAAGRLPVDLVVAFRSYSFPFALGVASVWGDVPLVVDLDDDDVDFHRSIGDPDEADAYERLLDAISQRASAIVSSTPGSPGSELVPNSVPDASPAADLIAGGSEVLMVGNFTYPPNREGAEWFAAEVLPNVATAIGTVTFRMVGHGSSACTVEGAPASRIIASGFVDDLGPVYARSSVVIVPLLHGSGTRIKALEAFGHARPVVGTSIGLFGLEVRDRVDALVADGPEQFAAAVGEVLRDPDLARRLAAAGQASVAARYAGDVIDRRIAALVARFG